MRAKRFVTLLAACVALFLAVIAFGLLFPRLEEPHGPGETGATMRLIDLALSQYKQDQGGYPSGTARDMIWALTDPSGGWTRAGLDWFPKRKEVVDAWGNPFHYTGHTEYESSGRGVERRPNSGDYYNPTAYQLYSTGPNGKTWPATAEGGNDRLGGTERDDIRNWRQERFYTPDHYRRQ